MKIRKGFVSNSSSSSFILKLDKIPSSIEEMKVILFGENPPLLTAHWGDDAILTQRVAQIVYDDIKDAYTMNINSMINSVKTEIGSFNNYNYIEGYGFVKDTEFEAEFKELFQHIKKYEKNSGKYKPDWNLKKYYDELDKLSKPMLVLVEKAIWVKYNENDIFIEIEYGDNDGEIMSYIEHGGVLDFITVQRFSHH